MPPKAKTSEFLSWIATTYGEEIALGIWEEWQKQSPYIPEFPRLLTQRKEIFAGLKAGESTSAIARRLKISTVHLHYISRQRTSDAEKLIKQHLAPEKPDQISLFG